jgi:hypothetical protein
MTETAIDAHVPTASRSIAALAKIPPAIIAAAAALGAYQAAPILVEHFKLNSSLHVATPYTGVTILPTPTPLRPVSPSVVPPHEEVARPVVPPVARHEEAPTASIGVVEPRAAVAAVTTGAIMRPAMRRQSIRVRPPRLQFARGLSGVRGMIHLGHVVQMLHFIRRFHR